MPRARTHQHSLAHDSCPTVRTLTVRTLTVRTLTVRTLTVHTLTVLALTVLTLSVHTVGRCILAVLVMRVLSCCAASPKVRRFRSPTRPPARLPALPACPATAAHPVHRICCPMMRTLPALDRIVR